MKTKALISTLLLLLLLLVGPGFSRTLRVKNMESEIYVIDYRGPETHTYNPPPNRAGDRPRNNHDQTSLAHRHKSKRHGKKIVG